MWKGSVMRERTVRRGLRLATGSWNIIPISRRWGFQALSGSPVSSRPRKRIEPEWVSESPMTARPRVVFPAPLSPTRP